MPIFIAWQPTTLLARDILNSRVTACATDSGFWDELQGFAYAAHK